WVGGSPASPSTCSRACWCGTSSPPPSTPGPGRSWPAPVWSRRSGSRGRSCRWPPWAPPWCASSCSRGCSSPPCWCSAMPSGGPLRAVREPARPRPRARRGLVPAQPPGPGRRRRRPLRGGHAGVRPPGGQHGRGALMAAAIEIEHLTKVFRLYKEKYTSVKERALHLRKIRYQEFYALQDVQLDIEVGTKVD